MTRHLLAALPLLGAQIACLHAPTRPVETGERFDLELVTAAAPGGGGWKVEEGGAGPVAWARFERGAPGRLGHEIAYVTQRPGGGPITGEALLSDVRAESDRAHVQIAKLPIDVFGERIELVDRFGPLTVLHSGRALPSRPQREPIATFFREYDFVYPDRPDRRYRVGYAELARAQTWLADFDARADGFFSGVARRDPALPPAPPPERSWEALAAGPAVASLRGIGLLGASLRASSALAYRLAAARGHLGLDLGLDVFGGRSPSGQRGGFTMTVSAMIIRSWGAPWIGAGLDVGYAALTHLSGESRIDGIAAGPHLAAGADLLHAAWGALFLQVDALAETPRYYRGGVQVGMRFGRG